MVAAQGGHVDIVKLLLDSGSDTKEKNNVSTRRCIPPYMHVYIKWSMIWMKIVRRILTRWDEMIVVDRWWGWCMDSMWLQDWIFHTDMNIPYEIEWHFSLVSSQESYNFLDCKLVFVICIRIYRLTLIFG